MKESGKICRFCKTRGLSGVMGPGSLYDPNCPLCSSKAMEALTSSTRTFPSGATRDTEQGKFDYEGCLSPVVLRRFAAYMHACRQISNSTRTADDWQKGIPRDVYIKSMFRHFMDLWLMHRGGIGNLQETLCALLFNVQGYLFEVLKEEE